MPRSDSEARTWHLLTGAIAASAVVFQLALVLAGHHPLDIAAGGTALVARPDLSTRLVRFASYMTIWFNVLVAVTSALLASHPYRDGRLFRALRLDGLVLAVGGGLVHWFLLRPLLQLHGADYLADKLLHIIVPLLVFVGWLRFGPFDRIDGRDVLAFLVLPLGWLAGTLARGAATGWYPYPFLDAARHGYLRVGWTCAAITLLMLGLAVAAMWIDRSGVRGLSAAPE